MLWITHVSDTLLKVARTCVTWSGRPAPATIVLATRSQSTVAKSPSTKGAFRGVSRTV